MTGAGVALALVAVEVDVDGDIDLDPLNAQGDFHPNTLTIGSAGCVGEVHSTGGPGQLVASGRARRRLRSR
ncbi:MAG: hypothetical protein AAFP86_14415 [Planctomycetota bacterium]